MILSKDTTRSVNLLVIAKKERIKFLDSLTWKIEISVPACQLLQGNGLMAKGSFLFDHIAGF